MENKGDHTLNPEDDASASTRKEDHISLAFESAVDKVSNDNRFVYEPMFSPHPDKNATLPINIVGKSMSFPLWISSMTGGTEKANTINHNLARLCGELGLGMGLGSCRQLLYDDRRVSEFDIRQHMQEQPLMVNLGVAQVEELINLEELARIDQLIHTLKADGLIIHVNPLQEWLQPEGDRFKKDAFSTIEMLLSKANYPVMVKEVGQGFGKQSIERLLQLPLEALDLAGFGGTNFSKLELMRADEIMYNSYKDVFNLGHTCTEMLDWINSFVDTNKHTVQTKHIIFSGGIKSFLDGYYLMEKSKMPSLYAQASGFLKYATDYDMLLKHGKSQIEGLKMANAFLKVKQVKVTQVKVKTEKDKA